LFGKNEKKDTKAPQYPLRLHRDEEAPLLSPSLLPLSLFLSLPLSLCDVASLYISMVLVEVLSIEKRLLYW